VPYAEAVREGGGRFARRAGPVAPPLWYDPTVAFARWDPVRDLLAIHQRLDRFAPSPAGWTPSVDLYETATAYVLTAELPGLSREDLQIAFQDSRLTLSGIRPEHGSPCEQYHRIERGHGSFSRTFQLPLPIDSDGITADLRDGVLTVTCPKSSDASARRIRIS
jgi:HSP20 family protein